MDFEVLILDSCRLLRAQAGLLDDDVIDGHLEQIARLEALLDDAEPVAGSARVTLPPRVQVRLLSGLGAGLARLREAAEDRRHPARFALAVQHERLLHRRDQSLTDLLRDGRG